MYKKSYYILILITVSLFFTINTTLAAQVGIKYNRGWWRYPKYVLKDMKRLHKARIDTIMLCLPWSHWEHKGPGTVGKFVKKKVAPVLKYCAKHNMSVMISNHSVYWGSIGGPPRNWTIPKWVQIMPEYKASSQILTNPKFCKLQIKFLENLIKATYKYKSVFAYNLLNEPAAATSHSLKNFQKRWKGIITTCMSIRSYINKHHIHKKLLIGNAADRVTKDGYLIWTNTGKYNLIPLWTKILDYLAAQHAFPLIQGEQFYPNKNSIRTESSMRFNKLNYAIDHSNGGINWNTEDFRRHKHRDPDWVNPSGGNTPTLYDYDAAYNYEGLADAQVPNLKAFYPWRIGTPRGHDLTFFDMRKGHHDRATPYFYALRDLASGIDSFQSFNRSILPINRKQNHKFNPNKATVGISQRWYGNGIIKEQRNNVPSIPTSTIAAYIKLKPNHSIIRTVISAHWKDSGVKTSDSFCFLAQTNNPIKKLKLIVKINGTKRTAKLPVIKGGWARYEIPLKALYIKPDEINKIQAVGLKNYGKSPALLSIDEFLIRPTKNIPRQSLSKVIKRDNYFSPKYTPPKKTSPILIERYGSAKGRDGKGIWHSTNSNITVNRNSITLYINHSSNKIAWLKLPFDIDQNCTIDIGLKKWNTSASNNIFSGTISITGSSHHRYLLEMESKKGGILFPYNIGNKHGKSLSLKNDKGNIIRISIGKHAKVYVNEEGPSHIENRWNGKKNQISVTNSSHSGSISSQIELAWLKIYKGISAKKVPLQ